MRYASDTSPSRRPGKIAFEETARFSIHGVALDIVCYTLPTKFENSLLQLFIQFIFNNRQEIILWIQKNSVNQLN